MFWEEVLLDHQGAEVAGVRQNGGGYLGDREGIHSDGDKTCK